MGWDGASHEDVPKNVPSLANKAHIRMLWYTQPNVVLEAWVVSYSRTTRKPTDQQASVDIKDGGGKLRKRESE